jgi:hypothetical protein
MLKRHKNNVGKYIGGALYFHRDYIDDVLEEINYIIENNPDITTDFNIIKLVFSPLSVSFINSPDFDTADEPMVTESWNYIPAVEKWTHMQFANNPPVYHHKWVFVKDDYPYFDVDVAKRRSEWVEALPVNKCTIGFQKQWNKILEKFGS